MTTTTLAGGTALVLPGVPESVRRARALVRAELGERHPAAETAAMCVSELATNAILYTRSGLPGSTFSVTVQAGPDEVLVMVRDCGARPGAAPARAADEHGRGLRIVGALSGGRWGAEETSRGRVTWCRIPVLYVPAQRRWTAGTPSALSVVRVTEGVS